MSTQLKNPGSHPAIKGKQDVELIVGPNQASASKPSSVVVAGSSEKLVRSGKGSGVPKTSPAKAGKNRQKRLNPKNLKSRNLGPKNIADQFVVLHCGYSFPLLDEVSCQKDLEATYLDVISGKLDGETFNIWLKQNLEFTRNVVLPDECPSCKKRSFVLCGAHALHAKCFFTVLDEEPVPVEELDALMSKFVRLPERSTVSLTAEEIGKSQQGAIGDIFSCFLVEGPVGVPNTDRIEAKCDTIDAIGLVGPSKTDVLVDLIDLGNDNRVYTVEDAVKTAVYDTSFNVQAAIDRNKTTKDENRVDMLEKGISAFRQVDKVRKSKFSNKQCPTNTIVVSGTQATCQPEPKVVLKPTWIRRIIFNEKPSEFLMHSNAQHRIGELRTKKQEIGRNIFDDSFLDVELFNHLRVSAFTKYSGRPEKLEHFNKLAQKYYLDNKIKLDTSYLVNLSKVTIQKATDSITDDFLLDAVDPEEPRKQRFTVDWLKEKVGLKRRVEHHFC